MKTSKMILTGLVLLGFFYGGQAQEVKKKTADSTTTKTVQKTIKLNSAADLQNLLQLFGGQAATNGKKTSGDSMTRTVTLNAETMQALLQMLGQQAQMGGQKTGADSATRKTIRLNLKSADDLQNLLKMLGGKGQVKEQPQVKQQKVKQDSINGRPAWWGKSVLNEKAPKLIVDKWITGEPKLEGKFMLLDYWSTTCGPCRKAIPKMNEWSKMFKKNLVVIGCARDDGKDKDCGIEYYRTANVETFEPLNLHVLSYVLLVDPKGIVRWEGVCHDLTTEKLKEIIAKYK